MIIIGVLAVVVIGCLFFTYGYIKQQIEYNQKISKIIEITSEKKLDLQKQLEERAAQKPKLDDVYNDNFILSPNDTLFATQ